MLSINKNEKLFVNNVHLQTMYLRLVNTTSPRSLIIFFGSHFPLQIHYSEFP